VKGEGGTGFLTGVTDIAAGIEHGLAAVGSHGTVWAWGRNSEGQLGKGSSSTGDRSSTPVQAIQLFGATEVAAGDVHSLAVADADTTAPTTTATPSPAPNAASWNNSNVNVTLSAADNPGGSGVKQISYSASGTQTIPSTTEPGDTASVPTISAEGQTTITFSARDNATNTEFPQKSFTVKLDKTLPTGSVTINGGDDFTNDAAVNLALTADDPPPNSGVAQMRFSNDGTNWSGWEPFAASKSWSLAGGDGEKTVHVQFKDAAGNESDTVQDSIGLDTAAPSVEVWKPKGKNVSPRAKPTVIFSEAMDEVTVEAGGAFTLKKGAKIIGGTVSYVEDSQGGPYKAILKPDRPLKPGATYTATMTTAATDPASNQLEQDPNPNAPAGVAKTWKFRVKT
jgi:hypothetical protein